MPSTFFTSPNHGQYLFGKSTAARPPGWSTRKTSSSARCGSGT